MHSYKKHRLRGEITMKSHLIIIDYTFKLPTLSPIEAPIVMVDNTVDAVDDAIAAALIAFIPVVVALAPMVPALLAMD